MTICREIFLCVKREEFAFSMICENMLIARKFLRFLATFFSVLLRFTIDFVHWLFKFHANIDSQIIICWAVFSLSSIEHARLEAITFDFCWDENLKITKVTTLLAYSPLLEKSVKTLKFKVKLFNAKWFTFGSSHFDDFDAL